MTAKLIELRKQAEKAVSDMHDGDLKTKAFETILSHLLSGAGSMPEAQLNTGKKVLLREEKTLPKNPTSLLDRILSLKADGFFDKQRSIAEIRAELKKNGWHYPVTSMSGPLQALVQKKAMRREKITDAKGRKGWNYSNP